MHHTVVGVVLVGGAGDVGRQIRGPLLAPMLRSAHVCHRRVDAVGDAGAVDVVAPTILHDSWTLLNVLDCINWVLFNIF